MLRSAALICLLVCFFQLPDFGNCGGTIRFKLISYVNDKGEDASGDHCDSAPFGLRTTKCDFYFDFYMTGASGRSGDGWKSIRTKVYTNLNSVYFDDNLGNGHGNPRFGQFGAWTGYIRYRLAVYDSDHMSGDDNVDTITHYVNLAANDQKRYITQGGYVHGSNTRFTFEVTVWCNTNYYGWQCKTYCQPQNSATGGHYTCDSNGNKICRPGWQDTGNNCKTRNFCHNVHCKNGGRCENFATDFKCHCPVEYKGRYCETRRLPCEISDRCTNGGKCVNKGSSAICECPVTWKGPTCNEDVNECLSGTPCMNNGTCINEKGGFSCNCTFGFSGLNCSMNVNECLVSVVNPCKNRGRCVDSHGSYSCQCLPQFKGDHCETDVDECSELPNQCLNNGTCTNKFGGYNCSCPKQFDGTQCENDVNECIQSPSPCKNNGTCSNKVGGFNCLCPLGLTGLTCEEDEDECNLDKNFCLNGGTCVNYFGGAKCACPVTRTGPKCEQDVNECTANPCQNNGTCENLVNSDIGYVCHCKNYHGRNCTIDIDECKKETDKDISPCGMLGKCTNLPGTYNCSCLMGLFKAVGKPCKTIPKSSRFTGEETPWNWKVPVIVLLLLAVLIALAAFFGYRRRSQLKELLPNAIKERIETRGRSGSTLHFSKSSDTVDADFQNDVYTEGPQHSDLQISSTGDFDNGVYANGVRLHAPTQGTGTEYDEYAGYSSLNEASTLPNRPQAEPHDFQRSNVYDPDVLETSDINFYESTETSPYETPHSYVNHGADFENESTTHPNDVEEISSGEEGEEDEDAYAQLPHDVYNRPFSQDVSNLQFGDKDEPTVDILPPPLPSRDDHDFSYSEA